MKYKLLAVALWFAVVVPSQAIVISQWTFETSQPATVGPIAPEAGIGSASSVGVGGLNSPAGNGSAHSYGGNGWIVGDYFQFQLSTAGFQDIVVDWDQTRSSGGPSTFDFAYSLDGISFTIASDNYSVGIISWSSVNFNSGSHISLDLGSVLALGNASTVYFRLVADSIAGGTTGTVRVDNFTVSGTRIPDTGATAMLMVLTFLPLGLLLLRRPATRLA